MSKIKIFLDFDGTAVDSVRAYCDVYNKLFNGKANHTKVNRWDLADECPKAVKYVEDIFASKEFFDYLELIDQDTKDVLDQIKQNYEVIICSIGTPENISRKAEWVNRNLDIQDMILISKHNATMDKSLVNMSNSIIIDDNENNLFSSDADIKICFGEVKSWNENWDGLRAKNWKELGELLL